MTITTVALLKLARPAFDALPRADAQPDDGTIRVKDEDGATYTLRLLDDGATVATALPFGDDAEALIDALWTLFGDALADHDDDRGIFVLPSVALPRSGTYDAVLAEVGEVGEWIAIDDEEGDEDDAHEGNVEDVGPAASGMPDMGGMLGGDFMSAMANITQALGPETLMRLQSAMMRGDSRAMADAQNAVAAKIAQRPELAMQLQGLMGMMPPELLQMANNASPEDMMKQMQGLPGAGRKPGGGQGR